jgi:DNA-binding SARP family transcriptional activator/predicted ATPase
MGPCDGLILVDTPAWFAWLETANIFGVLLAEGHFTAHKERASHGRGGWYWRAFRRQHGRLVRAYLGASADLSLERLRRAAAQLAQAAQANSTRGPAALPDRATSKPRGPDQQVTLRPDRPPPEASSTLRLSLLGTFSLSSGGDAPIDISSPRLRALLAYLALHRSTAHTRQHLSFVLWPDSPEDQARNNLRQLVHQLRLAWGPCDRWLSLGPNRIAWRPDMSVEMDVEEFERAVAKADEAERVHDAPAMRAVMVQALGEYGGDLLPGCYEDWINSDRERLRQAYARVLDRVISLCEDQGDYASAIEHAQRRLRHDPLDEQSYRRLMHLHALDDDRVSALRIYHACVSMLEREFSVPPSRATRQAYADLLRPDGPSMVTSMESPTLVSAAPLIGRSRQWDQLQSVWRVASAGSPRFVVLSGEAGIGKTRLAEELLAWASRQGIVTASSRAYAAEGRLAYAPVAEWLRSTALRAAALRIDAPMLSEVARIVPELLSERPDVPHLPPLGEPWQRPHFFESLARAVLSTDQPLLLLLDDLQWCDEDTLEWLHYLLRFNADAPLLLIGTARTEEVGAQAQLATFLTDLRSSGQVIELDIGPLNAAETAELGMHLAGRALDADEARDLYQETEGLPLFVVEAVRARLAPTDRPLLPEPRPANGASYTAANAGRLPPRVLAVIAARLAHLSDTARDTVRLAATIGRDFTLDLLIEASDRDADSLVGALDELWQRRIVRERGGAAYDFSHDKIREVAYSELSAARRSMLHRRVAQALEHLASLDDDAVSAQVAMHYAQGGLPARAVPHFQRAATLAQRRYASADAIQLLRQALTLLAELPSSRERDLRELELQTALATSLVATTFYGSSEVMRVYRRCQELCRHLGQRPSPPVLRGLALAAIAHSRFDEALGLGEHLLSVGTQLGDRTVQVEGHYVQGVALFWKGALASARLHLELALSQYAPEQLPAHLSLYAQDPRVVCLCRLAMVLWLLGFPKPATQKSAEALQVAQDLSHPMSLGYALGWNTLLAIEQNDSGHAGERAELFLAVAREQEMEANIATATILRGWARAQLVDRRAGIAEMRAGIARYRALQFEFLLPYYLHLLAEQLAELGRIDQARKAIAQAFTIVERNGERWYEAELHRSEGVLELKLGDDAKAERAFMRALDVSRAQTARTLELRAATSLARLWRRRSRAADAVELLSETSAWFDEGVDTLDLIDARSVLAACRGTSA